MSGHLFPSGVVAGFSLVRETERDFPCMVIATGARRQHERTMFADSAQWHEFVSQQLRFQNLHYRRTYPNITMDILVDAEGGNAGRLCLDVSDEEIRIVDILLIPGLRNYGSGTAILRAIQAEATRRDLPVRLHVDKMNAGACRLYARLGFSVVEDRHPDLFMEWRPPPVEQEITDLASHRKRKEGGA